MNLHHYIDKCSQRPMLSTFVVLILLIPFVIFSVFVADMVSIYFNNNNESWNASAAGGQWAGALVTFIGFVFVLVQLNRETREIQNQTKWQVYNNGLTTLSIFVDHPELRRYFYNDNVPVPEESEDNHLRSKVFAAAEMLADHWESTILSNASLNSNVIELWIIYMGGIYCKSPVLQEFLKNENEGYRYSDEFKNILKKYNCHDIKEFKARPDQIKITALADSNDV
jgi:hypothetical protein